ncbi:MAG: heparinase II/III family protein, partial [Candidatus Latescibacteria bacterium]|nr:heparinase II/III family protein [Candidatus Latescibacterota bacterium]
RMFHHVDVPEKIIHITDKAFFDAINLNHPGLENVQKAVQTKQYDKAFTVFLHHFITRKNPIDPKAQSKTGLQSRIVANPTLADLMINGGTHQFGQVEIDFSKPVDFNADFGDQSKYGFHYLNWMECLPHAALETSDKKYVETYLNLIRQWYAVHAQITGERPMHPVYYELGLGGRSRRFLDFLHTVRHLNLQDLFTPGDIRLFFKLLLGAGRWLTLEQNATGYRKGNWQLFGVKGLLAIGFSLPEFIESEEFRTVGSDFLEQHLEQDYYSDGGHSERCYSYGEACLKIIEEATLLAEANPDLTAPQRLNWREHTERAYLWFLKMTGPNGELPGVNDGIFMRATDLFERAYAFTQNTTYLYPIRHTLNNDLTPQQPNFASTRLKESEFCAMRGGWKPDDPFLVINHGHCTSGHSHMGILDFTLYAHSVPFIADVGRFGPYDAPWDMFFRSEQAHNHIVVEGAPSKRPEIRGENIHFDTASNFDYFSGQHRAYEETANVLIERRILFIKPWGFLISDTASAPPRRKSYLWYLHSIYPFTRHEQFATATQNDLGLLVVPENIRQLQYAHLGIDYEQSLVREIPLYSGQDASQWQNRYFMALRGWDVEQHITPFDVLLMPYRGTQPHATVQSLPCTIEGEAPAPTLPRVLEIEINDRTLQVFHSTTGVTVSTQNITFSGQIAAIEYQNNRPIKAFAYQGEKLTVDGNEINLLQTEIDL